MHCSDTATSVIGHTHHLYNEQTNVTVHYWTGTISTHRTQEKRENTHACQGSYIPGGDPERAKVSIFDREYEAHYLNSGVDVFEGGGSF